MNSKLLDSQIATLEIPKDALRIEVDSEPVEIVDRILEKIPLAHSAGSK